MNINIACMKASQSNHDWNVEMEQLYIGILRKRK